MENRHKDWWDNMGADSGSRKHSSGHGNRGDRESSTEINSILGGSYMESDAVKALREQMETQLGLKPGDYVSQWQPQIDNLVNDILNRKDFSYDVNADALYQQYKDRYIDLGQQAMMDTMGQAAALTGGYGNSAAQIAGQQVYQGYLKGLTDKIPELYQLALDRYNQQGQDMYQRYGLLNTQEQNSYNQWQDNFNRWLAERDYTTGRYDTERGFDYGSYRDKVSDAQWKENLAAQERQWQAQLQLQREQFEWQKAMAEAEAAGGGGGVGSSGGGSSGGGGGEDTISAIMYAGQKAQNEGLASATQWIEENSGSMSSAEKKAALDNANGAARTEAIKKALGG